MLDRKLKILIETYKDCRNEIEQRISQRDSLANQFIVAMGAVFSLGLMDFRSSAYFFCLLPFVALFYTVQIFYSYSIHDRLHEFISSHLEPAIAQLLEIKNHDMGKYFWESYCRSDSDIKAIKTPGIRKGFFKGISYVIPFLSGGAFYLVNNKSVDDKAYSAIFAIAFAIVTFILIVVTLFAFDRNNKNYIDHKCPRDYIDESIKENKSKKRAIFLDRDGTIHVDKVQTHEIDKLELFPDTKIALKRLQNLGFILVIITNQDGIKQRKYRVKKMSEFNSALRSELAQDGITIAGIYYSPHEKKENHFSFKPNPGMLVRAKFDLNIDLSESYLIGDQVSDVIAGERVGVESLMVITGIYENSNFNMDPNFLKTRPATFKSLTAATEYIENKEKARLI